MAGPAHSSRHTGQEAIIKVPGGEEIAVTNVSFDIEVNTTDVQTNQGMKPDHARTGLRYSGSFEYDGEQDKIRAQLFYSASDKNAGEGEIWEPGEPKRVTMTVEETASDTGGGGSGNLPRTWTLERVIVTSMSRDVPSDDVTSTSWDFEAEDAYVSAGGFDGSTSRSS